VNLLKTLDMVQERIELVRETIATGIEPIEFIEARDE
jgi:hypothetical protein